MAVHQRAEARGGGTGASPRHGVWEISRGTGGGVCERRGQIAWQLSPTLLARREASSFLNPQRSTPRPPAPVGRAPGAGRAHAALLRWREGGGRGADRRIRPPAPGSRPPAPGSRPPAPGSRPPAPGSRPPALPSRRSASVTPSRGGGPLPLGPARAYGECGSRYGLKSRSKISYRISEFKRNTDYTCAIALSAL